MLRSNWERFYVVFMVLLFITGLSLAVYPYIQGAVVDRRMTLEAEDFLSRFSGDPEDGELDIIVFPTVSEAEEERKHQDLWDAMIAYNESIYEEGQSGLSTSYAYQVPSFTLTDYGLEDEKFGVIQIPKLDLEMPLFLGASNQHMAGGAAVLTETSIPIGGSNTNAVIAGHRGYGGASYFRYVTDLAVGDEVIITNLWEALTYKVVETKIIDPHEVGGDYPNQYKTNPCEPIFRHWRSGSCGGGCGLPDRLPMRVGRLPVLRIGKTLAGCSQVPGYHYLY